MKQDKCRTWKLKVFNCFVLRLCDLETVMKREKEPEEMKRVARAKCLVEEMAQEEIKIVEKHRVRWADMDEDLEMERVVTVEEREEQRETARCGELEMKAEKREWEGKAVQDRELAAMKAVRDGELAAIEEQERERQLQKNQGGVDDAEGGTGRERENWRNWDEVWAAHACLECGEKFFLGCKCGNGPPRVRVTREGYAGGKRRRGRTTRRHRWMAGQKGAARKVAS